MQEIPVSEISLFQIASAGRGGEGLVQRLQLFLKIGRLLLAIVVLILVISVGGIQAVSDIGQGVHGIEADITGIEIVIPLQQRRCVVGVLCARNQCVKICKQGFQIRTQVFHLRKRHKLYLLVRQIILLTGVLPSDQRLIVGIEWLRRLRGFRGLRRFRLSCRCRHGRIA